METFIVILLDGSFFGAMALIPAAAVLAFRKKYLTGALLGAASLALQVFFAWMWFSAFVRPGTGMTWLDLAVLKRITVETAMLVCGIAVTAANVLLLISQQFRSARNAQV